MRNQSAYFLLSVLSLALLYVPAQARQPDCFKQCVNACATNAGIQTVDMCTSDCTLRCSRDDTPVSPLRGAATPAMLGYGAIAISPTTLQSAVAGGTTTQAEADKKALTACHKENKGKPNDCIIGLRFRNVCAALAIKDDPEGNDSGWGVDWAETSQAAEAQALRNCNKTVKQKSCVVSAALCTK